MNTEEALTRLRSLHPEGYIGNACELGAADGEYLSNTLELEEEGWDVLCIEANPFYAEDLFANRKKALICGVGTSIGLSDFFQYEDEREGANWASSSGLQPRAGRFQVRPPFKIPVLPLCRILRAYDMESLDFLSLDVEGREIDVLMSLGSIRPKSMLVEIVDDPEMKLHAVAVKMGYTLVDADGQDAFYALG